jgi:hypothetical protein
MRTAQGYLHENKVDIIAPRPLRRLYGAARASSSPPSANPSRALPLPGCHQSQLLANRPKARTTAARPSPLLPPTPSLSFSLSLLEAGGALIGTMVADGFSV